MDTATAPCQQCQREIPHTASVCPECGYDPQANGRLIRKIFLVGGVLLTLSIIGAPLGIPMLALYAIADWQVSKQTPTAD